MTQNKYRIWDGHKMEYSVMAGKLGLFYVEGLDKKDSACMSSFNTKYPSDVKEMKFTGATDILGIEVWQGDIVKRDKAYYEVIWFQPYCGFCLQLGNAIVPLNMNMNIEVVGNIYKNSNLLAH